MNKQSLLIVFTALSACLVHGCGGDDGSESASNAGKGGTSSGKGGSGGSALGRDDDNDGYVTPQDCDDSNPDVHPGATEVCNGIDDNCDGRIDEWLLTTYYRDADNAGLGSNDPSARMQACSQPAGYVTISGG